MNLRYENFHFPIPRRSRKNNSFFCLSGNFYRKSHINDSSDTSLGKVLSNIHINKKNISPRFRSPPPPSRHFPEPRTPSAGKARVPRSKPCRDNRASLGREKNLLTSQITHYFWRLRRVSRRPRSNIPKRERESGGRARFVGVSRLRAAEPSRSYTTPGPRRGTRVSSFAPRRGGQMARASGRVILVTRRKVLRGRVRDRRSAGTLAGGPNLQKIE